MKKLLNQVTNAGYVTNSLQQKIIKIILNWLKKVLVIFHNLKEYGSHLIMQKIGKFDGKISFTPNGLEKYMNFTIHKNLFLFLTACNLRILI